MANKKNFQEDFEKKLNKIRSSSYTDKDLAKITKELVESEKPKNKPKAEVKAKSKVKKDTKKKEEKTNKFLDFIERQLESIRRVLGY